MAHKILAGEGFLKDSDFCKCYPFSSLDQIEEQFNGAFGRNIKRLTLYLLSALASEINKLYPFH